MRNLLESTGIHAGYGDVPVLRGIDLTVGEGEIVALLGLNGAGKTTFLRVVSGLLKPTRGTVLFDGKRIDGQQVHRVVRFGISMVPEGKQLWPQMTVREHLQVVLQAQGISGPEARERFGLVFGLFPLLKIRETSLASTFSGGEQQMLAIARALMSKPRLLLMDEPSLGLAPIVVSEMLGTIKRIQAEGVSVLLVEQSVRQALRLADRFYLMDHGQITKQGRGAEAQDDALGAEALFGG